MNPTLCSEARPHTPKVSQAGARKEPPSAPESLLRISQGGAVRTLAFRPVIPCLCFGREQTRSWTFSDFLESSARHTAATSVLTGVTNVVAPGQQNAEEPRQLVPNGFSGVLTWLVVRQDRLNGALPKEKVQSSKKKNKSILTSQAARAFFSF